MDETDLTAPETISGSNIWTEARRAIQVPPPLTRNVLEDHPAEPAKRVRIERRTGGVEMDIEIEGYDLDDAILLAQALLR